MLIADFFLDNTTTLESINITNVITIGQEIDPEDARLETNFTPNGDKKLGLFDVFVPIMGAMCELAPLPSTYRSNGLIEGLVGYAAGICILPVPPLRQAPPYLENQWLIRAVSRIPAYMLEQRRFGDIEMNLVVDGIPVGKGAMSHLPSCKPVQPA